MIRLELDLCWREHGAFQGVAPAFVICDRFTWEGKEGEVFAWDGGAEAISYAYRRGARRMTNQVDGIK